MNNLKTLFSSHPHGWSNIGEIEQLLMDEGFTIKPLERNNRTDGEWHKMVSKNDAFFSLRANQWDDRSFQPLLDWLEKNGFSDKD